MSLVSETARGMIVLSSDVRGVHGFAAARVDALDSTGVDSPPPFDACAHLHLSTRKEVTHRGHHIY